MIKAHQDIFRSLLAVFTITAAAFLFIRVVESSSDNATLSLKKAAGSGLFTLNLNDSQGIKNFALVFPTDKFPYSGDLNGCPRTHTIDKVSIEDPGDFTPLMNAAILDCQGNETEFEITAPVNGIAQVKKVGIAPPPPPPPPPPRPAGGPAPSTGSRPLPVPSATSAEVAQDPLAVIQYPVSELGNCDSKEACKTYCEKGTSLNQCLAFAEKNGLLKHSEIERGKKFAQIVNTGGGPGKCATERACFDYCNDVNRIDECVAFAEKNGFMEGRELDEAKKIQSIVKSGKNLPGNCKNRTACEAYCKNLEHMDECIAFAKESGFMSAEEIAEAEKFLPLMKSGRTPGGCKSREECETFCDTEGNFEACFDFADKAGLITDKEREIMKKTGGKGPGGCHGRACQTFCENPANQKTCFEFGKEHGLISEADMARMEEGKQMLKKQLETGPPEVQECLKSVIDVNVLEQDGFAGGPELGEKMRGCFEKLIPQGMEGQFEFGEGGEFHGPGGCTSREECEAYCQNNPEACGFGGGGGPGGGGFPGGPGGGFPGGQGGFPPGGGIPSGESYVGPGGCATPEECIRYCTEPEHDKECEGFKTAPTTPYAGGAGPGGCGSVEECRAYCKSEEHKAECGAFISDETPSEARCQSGFETKTDNKGYKYCSPLSCPEGQQFITDFYGRQACSPIGASGGVTPSPTTDYQKQYEEQYKQQYEQQYQQQVQQGTTSCEAGYVLKTDLSGKQYCSIVCPTGSTLDNDKAGQEYCAPACGAGSMLKIDETTGRKSCVTEAGQAPRPTFGDVVASVLAPILMLMGF